MLIVILTVPGKLTLLYTSKHPISPYALRGRVVPEIEAAGYSDSHVDDFQFWNVPVHL